MITIFKTMIPEIKMFNLAKLFVVSAVRSLHERRTTSKTYGDWIDGDDERREDETFDEGYAYGAHGTAYGETVEYWAWRAERNSMCQHTEIHMFIICN